MPTLHKVTQREELQAVLTWLEQYLPDSYAMFNYTRAVLEGRWAGESIYTLGWPSISAVATSGMEPGHPAPDHYSNQALDCLFATEDADIDFFLDQQEIVDWSKSFMKRSVPTRVGLALERIAKERGVMDKCNCFLVNCFHANPEDIEKRPVPEGYRIRPLRTDRAEIEYCVSTWAHASSTSVQGVTAYVDRFPSACLVDTDDRIVSFEAMTNQGTLGILYTKEECRGRGFAKVVTSHMAQESAKLNWHLYACTVVGNDPAYSFHQGMGFKCLDKKFAFFAFESKPV